MNLDALTNAGFEIKAATILNGPGFIEHYIYVQKGQDVYVCTFRVMGGRTKEMPVVKLG